MKKQSLASMALGAALIMGIGHVQAHVVEDIYTGNFCYNSGDYGCPSYAYDGSFIVTLKFNDQLGISDYVPGQYDELSNSGIRNDPTIYASLTLNGRNFVLSGPASYSDYVIDDDPYDDHNAAYPNHINSSYANIAGDYIDIEAYTPVLSSILSKSITKTDVEFDDSESVIGSQSVGLFANTVQVIVDGGSISDAPEPLTWTLMTGGIGVVGATLRRQRKIRFA